MNGIIDRLHYKCITSVNAWLFHNSLYPRYGRSWLLHSIRFTACREICDPIPVRLLSNQQHLSEYQSVISSRAIIVHTIYIDHIYKFVYIAWRVAGTIVKRPKDLHNSIATWKNYFQNMPNVSVTCVVVCVEIKFLCTSPFWHSCVNLPLLIYNWFKFKKNKV